MKENLVKKIKCAALIIGASALFMANGCGRNDEYAAEKDLPKIPSLTAGPSNSPFSKEDVEKDIKEYFKESNNSTYKMSK